MAVTWPEKIRPFVTRGETQIGKSVLCSHFTLPVTRSRAIIEPFPIPVGEASKAGATDPPAGVL